MLCTVVLTFESVDKILLCDHSNDTSLPVLLHGTSCFSIFYKIILGILYEFLALLPLGDKWLRGKQGCLVEGKKLE